MRIIGFQYVPAVSIILRRWFRLAQGGTLGLFLLRKVILLVARPMTGLYFLFHLLLQQLLLEIRLGLL
jgi:hypothetical protein